MMEDFFLDSSALVKRYIREIGSVWVESLFDSPPHIVCYIAAVTPAEIIAALTRRSRGGTLSPEVSTAARALFRADLLTDYRTVELAATIVDESMRIAEEHGLRGYDSVQLAAALAVNHLYLGKGATPITFISADQQLNAAALSEGMIVDNPNDHP